MFTFVTASYKGRADILCVQWVCAASESRAGQALQEGAAAPESAQKLLCHGFEFCFPVELVIALQVLAKTAIQC